MDPDSLSIKAIGKRQSLWGEGPIWWNDSLYYVDIEGKAIIRLNPNTEEETENCPSGKDSAVGVSIFPGIPKLFKTLADS